MNDKIKITVEETTQEGEVRTLTIEKEYGGSIEEVTQEFRAILYWLTFAEGTINDTVADGETIEEMREERIAEFANSKEE